MKTKLYKKFIKSVCHDFKISKKQLFTRDFDEHVLRCYVFDHAKQKYVRDDNRLIVVGHHHPLSQFWYNFGMHATCIRDYCSNIGAIAIGSHTYRQRSTLATRKKKLSLKCGSKR